MNIISKKYVENEIYENHGNLEPFNSLCLMNKSNLTHFILRNVNYIFVKNSLFI